MVLDVHRHLGHPGLGQVEAEGAHARGPTPRLAHAGGDGAGLGQGPLGQPDVERDQRRAHAHQRGAGRRVQARGPVVGHELAALDRPAELLQPTAAEVARKGPGRVGGHGAVEEDRQVELGPEAPGEAGRDLAGQGHVVVAERHDRGDVERADAWVDPAMAAQVDAVDALAGQGHQRVLEGERLPHDGEDAAVVVGVGVDVDHAGPGPPACVRESGDDARVAALADVGHGERERRRGRGRQALVEDLRRSLCGHGAAATVHQ